MSTGPDGHPLPPSRHPPAGTLPPLVLDQAFDSDSLSVLRAALAERARQAGLPPDRTEAVVITVRELAANAVRHGAGHGRLRIWRLHQACSARSGTTVPVSLPEPGRTGRRGGGARPWRAVPGHGLSVARRLTDHLSVHTGPNGTVATVSFALSPGLLPDTPPPRMGARPG